MKGEAWCKKAPEDSAHSPWCCVHLRPRKLDYICCWCGDLFLLDEPPAGPHGQYARNKQR